MLKRRTMNTSGYVRADAVGNEGRSQNSSRAWGGVADPMTRVSLVYEADHTAVMTHSDSSPVLARPAIMRSGGVGVKKGCGYRSQIKIWNSKFIYQNLVVFIRHMDGLHILFQKWIEMCFFISSKLFM